MRPVLPIALAVALILSIAVAWSPRYWPVAVALGSISLVGLAWAVTARSFRGNAMHIVAVLVSVWGLFQIAFARTAAPWLTGRVSLNWLGFGIAFVVASQILISKPARNLFLRILLWAVTVLSVLAMVQTYAHPGTQAVGTFLYKNQFAAMLELAAPIALWRALRGREHPAVGAIFFAVLFAAAVVSASRAGVILLAVEFVCALAIARSQRRVSSSTAGTMALTLIALAITASAIAGPEKIVAHFREDNSYAVRARLLGSTLRMIPEHPWLGSGMGTWRLIYPRFATFDSALVANEAHNDWAEWAAEGGIPFSCLMFVLVAFTVRSGVSTSWGLGVLMVMIHSLADYPTREPAIGLLWFALAGALAAHKSERKIAGAGH